MQCGEGVKGWGAEGKRARVNCKGREWRGRKGEHAVREGRERVGHWREESESKM